MRASPSPLPLRNLLIEVRQIDHQHVQQTDVNAQGQLGVGAGGSVGTLRLGLGQSDQQRSSQALQQVLVLNGRTATLLRNQSVTLRLMQAVLRQGVWRAVPSTVWVNAGTGFDALARWDGGGAVALTLSTQQSDNGPGSPGTNATTSASTTLIVPLESWMTIAQSSQSRSQHNSELLGQRDEARDTDLEIQVRISVR